MVASGIRYAADNGANVINMSLGFDGPAPLPAIEDAMNYAVARARSWSSPPATDFEDGNPVEALAEMAARIDGVISVGAVGRDLDARLLLEQPLVGRGHRAGRRPRVGGNAGAVVQQTYDPATAAVDPLDARWRCIARRASTSSATTATRARRWRRRTFPGSSRC